MRFCCSLVTSFNGAKVVDRESVPHTFIGREYIQPQWVYDSVNEGLPLPVHEYFQGVKLPVHLSPFIDDQKRGYVPDRRLQLDQYKARWKASQELQAETAPVSLKIKYFLMNEEPRRYWCRSRRQEEASRRRTRNRTNTS